MSDPTEAQVEGLWAHMVATFGSRVADKHDSTLMQAAARVLGVLGISDPKQFLEAYTTTIDGVIYTPFRIGDPSAWSLWDQVVVCAHEHQHIVQQKRVGPLPFDWQYLVDGDARARLEAQAYLCQMELEFWRYGAVLVRVEDLVGTLRGYGCNAAQIELAGDMVRSLAVTVAAGGVVNEASQVALAWLDQHAPEIREVSRT